MNVIYTGSPSPVTVGGHKFETGKPVAVEDKLGAALIKKPMFKKAPATSKAEKE